MRPPRLALPLFLLAAVAAPARAQEGEAVTAVEALTVETCDAVAKRVMANIEAYTRTKFRRPVPVGLLPKVVWENMLKQTGFGGEIARSGLAFYTIEANSITVNPWVIGGFQAPKPTLKSRVEWIDRLESIMIHELFHALHNQNFHVVLGGARTASLRTGGQSAQEIAEATVEFLTAEGTAELVSVRTASASALPHLIRRPGAQLSSPEGYIARYQPNNKDPFRSILSASGYQDGLDVMHQLSLKAGPRGVRAILYRPPPPELFFQPEKLAALKLDDPPDPDSIFGYLSTESLTGHEVFLAVNPGHGRFFKAAMHTPGGPRAEGCLVGYVTSVGDESEPNGRSHYGFWVGDPDVRGTWSADQVASLKEQNPPGASEKEVPMSPIIGKGQKISVLTVKVPDGSLFVRGECQGLVVLAQESKPTEKLERRVLDAVAALYIRRPTPGLYAKR